MAGDLMWVRFTKAWEWTPPLERRVHMSYAAGLVLSVTRACGTAAIAAGAAVEATNPRALEAKNDGEDGAARSSPYRAPRDRS